MDPALKHFRAANGFDPWLSPSISWTADGNGVASVDLNAPGLSVYGAQAAYGRVVIVHRGDLNIGCGGQKLVGPTFSPPPSPPPSPPVSPLPRSPPAPPPAAPPPLVFSFDPSLPYAIVEIGQYPGETSRIARGTLAVQSSGGSLHFNGIVTGLEPGQTGGWHVHSGFTCDDAAKVGGHYFKAGSADPWTLSNSFYVADTNGVATISHSEPDFTLHDDMAVAGRTVVFHLGRTAP